MSIADNMVCQLSDEELWSGMDRLAPEIVEHIEECPTCRARAEQFHAGIAAVTASSAPSIEPLPERIGPYRILRRLGVGGMGIVYEGEQQTPRRMVAVKVVRGGRFVDEYRLRLFKREVETLARLKHPSIAAIYEAGRTEEGEHYFTMELVRGVRLNEYVREREVSRRDCLLLFSQICDAIHYAHQRGVIHRDIKPTNILVDAEGSPKILDFGLARFTDTELGASATGTFAHRFMGTLPYMSPEEARGNPEEIDVRSDVYSLGVVLYEILTGHLPYEVRRSALHEAVRTICEEPPVRPGSLDRSLRGDLETILLKALEKERGRRYQSPEALAEDVERFLRSEPIHARRASPLYLLRKFVVRHGAVIILVAMIAVMGGLVVRINEGIQTMMAQVTDAVGRTSELAQAATYARVARDLYRVGNYDQAIRLYRESLYTYQRVMPDDTQLRSARVLVGLGAALASRGSSPQDYEEGYELMTRGLGQLQLGGQELSPDERVDTRAALVRYLAWCQGNQGDPDEPDGLGEATQPAGPDDEPLGEEAGDFEPVPPTPWRDRTHEADVQVLIERLAPAGADQPAGPGGTIP